MPCGSPCTAPPSRKRRERRELSFNGSYDKASAVAYKAQDDGTTLRGTALASGVSAEEFDRVVVPKAMVGDPEKDLGMK